MGTPSCFFAIFGRGTCNCFSGYYRQKKNVKVLNAVSSHGSRLNFEFSGLALLCDNAPTDETLQSLGYLLQRGTI